MRYNELDEWRSWVLSPRTTRVERKHQIVSNTMIRGGRANKEARSAAPAVHGSRNTVTLCGAMTDKELVSRDPSNGKMEENGSMQFRDGEAAESLYAYSSQAVYHLCCRDIPIAYAHAVGCSSAV